MQRICFVPVLILIGCGDEVPSAGSRSTKLAPLERKADSDAATEEFAYIAADPNAPEPQPDPPEELRVEVLPVERDFDALVAEYLATSPAFTTALASMKVGVQPPADLARVPEPTYERSNGLGCGRPVPPPSPTALARPGGYVEGGLDSEVAWTDRLSTTPASDLVSPSTALDWVASDDGARPTSAKPKPSYETDP